MRHRFMKSTPSLRASASLFMGVVITIVAMVTIFVTFLVCQDASRLIEAAAVEALTFAIDKRVTAMLITPVEGALLSVRDLVRRSEWPISVLPSDTITNFNLAKNVSSASPSNADYYLEQADERWWWFDTWTALLRGATTILADAPSDFGTPSVPLSPVGAAAAPRLTVQFKDGSLIASGRASTAAACAGGFHHGRSNNITSSAALDASVAETEVYLYVDWVSRLVGEGEAYNVATNGSLWFAGGYRWRANGSLINGSVNLPKYSSAFSEDGGKVGGTAVRARGSNTFLSCVADGGSGLAQPRDMRIDPAINNHAVTAALSDAAATASAAATSMLSSDATHTGAAAAGEFAACVWSSTAATTVLSTSGLDTVTLWNEAAMDNGTITGATVQITTRSTVATPAVDFVQGPVCMLVNSTNATLGFVAADVTQSWIGSALASAVGDLRSHAPGVVAFLVRASTGAILAVSDETLAGGHPVVTASDYAAASPPRSQVAVLAACRSAFTLTMPANSTSNNTTVECECADANVTKTNRTVITTTNTASGASTTITKTTVIEAATRRVCRTKAASHPFVPLQRLAASASMSLTASLNPVATRLTVGSGRGTAAQSYTAVVRHLASHRIDGFGVNVVVFIPEGEFVGGAAATRQLYIAIGISVAVVVLGIAAAIAAVVVILRPLAELAEQMQRAAEHFAMEDRRGFVERLDAIERWIDEGLDIACGRQQHLAGSDSDDVDCEKLNRSAGSAAGRRHDGAGDEARVSLAATTASASVLGAGENIILTSMTGRNHLKGTVTRWLRDTDAPRDLRGSMRPASAAGTVMTRASAAGSASASSRQRQGRGGATRTGRDALPAALVSATRAAVSSAASDISSIMTSYASLRAVGAAQAAQQAASQHGSAAVTSGAAAGGGSAVLRAPPSIRAHTRTCAVMIADVAGFALLCERVPSAQLTDALGVLIARMTRLTTLHGGVVDKFVGDCVMSVWGAPRHCAHAELRSALCALACHRATSTGVVHAAFASLGERLRLRIGVASGESMAALPEAASSSQRPRRGPSSVISRGGGCEEPPESSAPIYRLDTEAIHLASQLEALNREWGTSVIVSDAVAAKVGGVLVTRLLTRLTMPGRRGRNQRASVDVYDVIGCRPDAIVANFHAAPSHPATHDAPNVSSASEPAVAPRMTDGVSEAPPPLEHDGDNNNGHNNGGDDDGPTTRRGSATAEAASWSGLSTVSSRDYGACSKVTPACGSQLPPSVVGIDGQGSAARPASHALPDDDGDGHEPLNGHRPAAARTSRLPLRVLIEHHVNRHSVDADTVSFARDFTRAARCAIKCRWEEATATLAHAVMAFSPPILTVTSAESPPATTPTGQDAFKGDWRGYDAALVHAAPTPGVPVATATLPASPAGDGSSAVASGLAQQQEGNNVSEAAAVTLERSASPCGNAGGDAANPTEHSGGPFVCSAPSARVAAPLHPARVFEEGAANAFTFRLDSDEAVARLTHMIWNRQPSWVCAPQH